MEVALWGNQVRLQVTRLFNPNELVGAAYNCPISNTPTMYSVQVGHDQHLDIRGTLLEYTSHSCEPNCFIKVYQNTFELYAMKQLVSGDAPSFDYEISEWCLNSPFQCICGSSRCRGLIRGAKFKT